MRGPYPFRLETYWSVRGFLHGLTELGYERVPLVHDPGEFAVRGSVIDVFSPGDTLPVRIDFFDDEVESIRTIGSGGQRSGERQKEFRGDSRTRGEYVVGRSKAGATTPFEIGGDSAVSHPETSSISRRSGRGNCSSPVGDVLGLFAAGESTIGHCLPPEATVVILSPDECEKERVAAREALHRERRESLDAGRLTPGVNARLGDPVELDTLGTVRIECPDVVLGRVKGPLLGFQCRSVAEVTTRITRERSEQRRPGRFRLTGQSLDPRRGKRVAVVCSSSGGQERGAFTPDSSSRREHHC